MRGPFDPPEPKEGTMPSAKPQSLAFVQILAMPGANGVFRDTKGALTVLWGLTAMGQVFQYIGTGWVRLPMTEAK